MTLPVNLPPGVISVYGSYAASVYGMVSGVNSFFAKIAQVGLLAEGYSVDQIVLVRGGESTPNVSYNGNVYFLVSPNDILMTEHENPIPPP